MSSTIHASALCLALALTAPAMGEQEAVSLGANLEPGDTLSYVYHNKLTQQQFTRDMLVSEAFLDYELEFDMTVMQVSDLYTDLELIFTRINVDSTWGAFDSDQPEEEDGRNLAAKAFRPVLGERFSVRLRSNMEILGITGPTENYVPDDVHALYTRIFREQPLTESLQPIFRLKPEPHEATPGEAWTSHLERHLSVGGLDIQLDFTLDSVGEDGVADVSIGGKHHLTDVHHTPVSPKITEETVQGGAKWNTADARLEEFDLEKSFVASSGGEQFALRHDISEREELSRTR